MRCPFRIPVTGTGVGIDFTQNFYMTAINGDTLTAEIQLVQTAVTDHVVDVSNGTPGNLLAQAVVPTGTAVGHRFDPHLYG